MPSNPPLKRLLFTNPRTESRSTASQYKKTIAIISSNNRLRYPATIALIETISSINPQYCQVDYFYCALEKLFAGQYRLYCFLRREMRTIRKHSYNLYNATSVTTPKRLFTKILKSRTFVFQICLIRTS